MNKFTWNKPFSTFIYHLNHFLRKSVKCNTVINQSTYRNSRITIPQKICQYFYPGTCIKETARSFNCLGWWVLRTLSRTLRGTWSLLKLLTVFQLPKYRVVETIKELTLTNTSSTKVEGEILFVISTKPSLNSTEICWQTHLMQYTPP